MTKKRMPDSPLDKLPSRHEGLDSELLHPREHSVPGMGLGATPQACRWAWIGFNIEMRNAIDGSIARPRGRPAKEPIGTKDAWRAWTLWRIAQNLEEQTRKNITNRELIDLASRVENELCIPNSERAFPPGGEFEQSVSRGRTMLEIGDDWKSELCEKIDQI